MFANRLKELRRDKEMTQIEFAEAFNISSGTVAMWETGKRTPDLNNITKIADYFGCSVDYLIGRSNVKSLDKDIQIACKVTKLSENTINSIINMNLSHENDLYLMFDILFSSETFIELIYCLASIFYESSAKLYYNDLIENSDILKKLRDNGLDEKYIERMILKYFDYNIQYSSPYNSLSYIKEVCIDRLDLANYRAFKLFSEVTNEIIETSKHKIEFIDVQNMLLLYDIEHDLEIENINLKSKLHEIKEKVEANQIERKTAQSEASKIINEFEKKSKTFLQFKKILESEVEENEE